MTHSDPTTANSSFQFHRLGMRLAANLAVAGLLGFGLIIALAASLIWARFGALEDGDIDQNLARTERMLATLQQTITEKSQDWSLWTATYNFINDRNQDYADENLVYASFVNLGVEAAALVGFDGVSRYTAYFDFELEEAVPELTDAFEAFVTSPESLAMAREGEQFSGFVRIADRLLVVSFSPIMTSNETGSPNGYLVFASELNDGVMSAALQVPASYNFKPSTEGTHAHKTSDHVEYYVTTNAIDGAPVAVIRFATPRDLRPIGRSLLTTIGLGIGGTLFLIIFLLNRRLRYLVAAPLAGMEMHVSQISSSGVLKQMKDTGRPDEIGKLITGFNEMALQLGLLRSKLERQSYELGQTQSSIDTMHNVRNGLTPIGPILNRITGLTDQPMEEDFRKAIEELSSADLDADRRAKLCGFLTLVQDQKLAQMAQAKDLVAEADQNVSTVVAAIEDSQRNSHALPETTAVSINDLVSHNLSLTRFAQDCPIDVNTDGLAAHTVETNHILLGQVLTNILSNAAESIAATGRQNGQITISSLEASENDAGNLRVAITDNGEGFEPAMANRLFERGFSNRTNKTGGTGLHWSANALSKLNGSLSIASEGRGHGATVEIVLPLSELDQDGNAQSVTEGISFDKAS